MELDCRANERPGKVAGRGRVLLALGFAVTVSLGGACGGTSPTRPSSPGTPPSGGAASLQVTAGPHLLILTGNTFNGNCTPLSSGVTAIGLAPPVMVEPDGSGWMARPSGAGAGDLVLRFRASGAETAIAVGLTGSATGTLTDAGSALGPPAGVRLTIDGQADLVGEQLKGANRPIAGEVRGTVRFVGAAGVLTTCTRVSWSLGPAGPQP